MAARLLRQEAYANALSVASELGGGEHGHLGLLMPRATYIARSQGGEEYEFPDKPDVPVYVGDANAREADRTNYRIELEVYTEARALRTQIKAQLLQAIPVIYREAIADPDTGYAEVTPAELLTHIMDSYGEITQLELDQNTARLEQPWDPEAPITTVFVNGNRCRKFAQDGGDPISDKFYMRALMRVFRGSGIMDEAIRTWDNKPNAQKIVTTMVAHFTKADKYHRDNKCLVKTVMEANATITKPVKVADLPAKPEHTDTSVWKYCWSHGLCGHIGAQCKYPAEGHVNEATILNTFGGSTKVALPNTKRKERKHKTPPAGTPETETETQKSKRKRRR
jgi:hypothetical protein